MYVYVYIYTYIYIIHSYIIIIHLYRYIHTEFFTTNQFIRHLVIRPQKIKKFLELKKTCSPSKLLYLMFFKFW